MENHYLKYIINYKWAIFNSYVKFPEGTVHVQLSDLANEKKGTKGAALISPPAIASTKAPP